MFGLFEHYIDIKATSIGIGTDKDVQERFWEFVVTYGKDYAVSAQLNNANAYKGSSGYKDIYIHQTLALWKTYVYTGEILVSDSDSTTPIIACYLAKDDTIPSATLSGHITDNQGNAIKNAYVIISKKERYKETNKSHGTI